MLFQFDYSSKLSICSLYINKTLSRWASMRIDLDQLVSITKHVISARLIHYGTSEVISLIHKQGYIQNLVAKQETSNHL
jgi:hypothetical protein